MARHALIDPRLKGDTLNVWPSKCTIKTVVYGLSGSNQKIPVAYTPIVGQVDIPCRLAPCVKALVGYDEDRTSKTTSTYNQMDLLLNVYLPNIQINTQVAVVDGVQYDVRGVDNDSQQSQTRVRVEITDGVATTLGSTVRTPDLSSQMPSATVTLPYLPIGTFFQLYRNGLLQNSNGYSRSGLTITLTPPGMAGEIIQAFYYS